MQKTSDLNVVETRPLPSPAALLAELPKTESQADFVTRSRRDIHRLIFTDERRFLLIIGPLATKVRRLSPCTISTPVATTPAV